MRRSAWYICRWGAWSVIFFFLWRRVLPYYTKMLSSTLLPIWAATSAASTCRPTFILNSSNSGSITLTPSCGSLDASQQHAVFLRGSGNGPLPALGSLVNGTVISKDGITVPGARLDGTIAVFATDGTGQPVLANIDGHSSPNAAARSNDAFPRAASCCGGCTTCSSSVICQPACQQPVYGSCSFYKACAEATLHCGPDGYPVHYGDRLCNEFVANTAYFTPQGQRWFNTVMHCLQLALIEPLSECGMTCDKLNTLAFDSHPRCYVDSGVCDLPLSDFVELAITVNKDFFAGPALKQALETAGGCLQHYIDEIGAEIDKLKDMAEQDVLHAGEYLGKVVVLEGIKAMLQ